MLWLGSVLQLVTALDGRLFTVYNAVNKLEHLKQSITMPEVSRIHLKLLQGRLGNVVYEFSKTQFTQCWSHETWRPEINAYRSCHQIIICVDLAGVERSSIELSVEPRAIRLRGHRQAPEPTGQDAAGLQVLAMEIDYGEFERQIELPNEVDPARVKAEQRNGLLWIHLPRRTPC